MLLLRNKRVVLVWHAICSQTIQTINIGGIMKEIKNLEDFNDFIQKEGLKVVDFYADWCAPCQMIKPILENLDEKFSDVEFAKVNVDKLPQIAGNFGIMGIPTLIFFKNGSKIDVVTGFMDEVNLSLKISKLKA